MATVTDLFCGAGGSSLGAELAGGELRLALNHWRRAIETHATNFGQADHECNDISALTTARIRGYPDTDILLASPECTWQSLAAGAKRRPPVAASLLEDGPAGSDEQERSRATMWDVCRFAEQKLLKGHPYKAIVVENVSEAFWWGPKRQGFPMGDGSLFDAWLGAMRALGYEHEIVWLNSMFAGPALAGRSVPQSRDRMYVCFWRKGTKTPNLRVEPLGWCPSCERLVEGRQTFKQVSLKKSGGRPWGKYGQQYFYTCPVCAATVFPGTAPAAEAIDWSLPIERIGDREKPLAPTTRGRIRRGWERVAAEPFALRVGGTGNPRPLTLPLMTQTSRHEAAMVFPNAANTYERTPGNRAREAARTPLDTVHGTLDRAMVIPPMGQTPSKDAASAPAPTPTSTTRPALITVAEPVAGGPTSGSTSPALPQALLMRNNRDQSGEQTTPATEPVRTLTAACHQSILIPYYRTGTGSDPTSASAPTVSTKDRLALVVPFTREARPRAAEREALTTVASEGPPAFVVTEEDIDSCRFRMFALHEISRAMAFADTYTVLGNKRERMAQYGNAVTPPAMELLVGRLLEVIA